MSRSRRILRPAAWPIAVKLSIVLLAASLVPMAVTAVLDVRQERANAEQAELQALRMLAQSTATRIDQLLEDMLRVVGAVGGDAEVVSFLGADPGGRAAIRASVQQTLNTVVRENDDIGSAFLLDPAGRSVLAASGEEVGVDLSRRDYFQEALKNSRYISEILVGRTTAQAGVYLSRTVKNEAGNVVGVSVVKLKGDIIDRMIAATHYRDRGGAFLIDSFGVIVSHPNHELLYRSLGPLSPELQNLPAFKQRFSAIGIHKVESLGLTDLAARMVGTHVRGSSSYVLRTDRERQIVGFAPLRAKTWTVGAFEPESTFMGALAYASRRTLVNVVLVGAVVTLLALALARSIVRPIRGLIQAAEALRAGNYSKAWVHVGSEDEIGALESAFSTMAAGLRERERELEIFGRLVSPEVREKLLAGNLELGGETRWAAVLFSDIRGFSTLSEKMDPQAVVKLLNEYMTEMTEASSVYRGYVNNFIGDAIVVIFGAPIPDPECERRAVLAAVAMRRRLAELNRRRVTRGDSPLETGIGIAAGTMVAGQVGSPQRMLYTVIGDAVNVASRLESLTKEYPGRPILVTRSVVDAFKGVPGFPQPEALGPVKLKGRHEPVDVFAVNPEGFAASSAA
jgi:class 3 adenylate cyclase